MKKCLIMFLMIGCGNLGSNKDQIHPSDLLETTKNEVDEEFQLIEPIPELSADVFEQTQVIHDIEDQSSCFSPYQKMVITKDITLCQGKFILDDADGKGVVNIMNDNIVVECKGTEILRPYKSNPKEPIKTTGIAILGRKNVMIRNCKISGFHYGIWVKDSENITITGCDLSNNFHDPNQDWVFDNVQGGGIRFENVIGGSIEKNLIKENWNGIELRSSSKVIVKDNDASHTSNTGILVISSHENIIENNDFSWGIRGGLIYPAKWYGIDTKDSAGILIDGGSSYNIVRKNNARYSGDGIFIRSVIGPCPHHNTIQENDASFSPHNAIENWCDFNNFIENIASDSHYGLWLGGGDFMFVSKNKVERNKVDGISVQIGENRHNVFDSNHITNSGRCGLLVSGREYQAWHGLDHVSENLVNASHIIVQRNIFDNNKMCDMFFSSVRGVFIMSNCTPSGQPPYIEKGLECYDVFVEGECPSNDYEPPQVNLKPIKATAQEPTLISAEIFPQLIDGEVTYYYLIQTPLAKFIPPIMPQPVFAGYAGDSFQMVFQKPGIYDVSVVATYKNLASLNSIFAFVPPKGDDLAEKNHDQWVTGCQGQCNTEVSDDYEVKAVGDSSIKVKTNAPFDFYVGLTGGWTLDKSSNIYIFLLCNNPNPNGWQGNFPVLEIKDKSNKTYKLMPEQDFLKTAQDNWIFLSIPVGGGNGWKVEDKGANLYKTTGIFLHMDTWDWNPYTIWIDGFIVEKGDEK